MESRTLTWLTGDRDETVCMLNGTMDNGQSQAGAATYIFGGKERFEDASANFS